MDGWMDGWSMDAAWPSDSSIGLCDCGCCAAEREGTQKYVHCKKLLQYLSEHHTVGGTGGRGWSQSLAVNCCWDVVTCVLLQCGCSFVHPVSIPFDCLHVFAFKVVIVLWCVQCSLNTLIVVIMFIVVWWKNYHQWNKDQMHVSYDQFRFSWSSSRSPVSSCYSVSKFSVVRFYVISTFDRISI